MLNRYVQFPYFFKARCFPLNGNVNCQNDRYWWPKNPYKVYYFPIDDFKLEVWCAVNARKIIRSSFRRKNVLITTYLSFCRHFLRIYYRDKYTQLPPARQCRGPHSTFSVIVLEDVLGERFISRGLWPLRIPHSNLSCYYL